MEKGSRDREDEVLPDWDRALLLCQFSIAIFREADFAPLNARVLPAESPSRLAGLLVVTVLIYIYIYIRCRVATRVRVEGRDHGGLGLRRRGEGIGQETEA